MHSKTKGAICIPSCQPLISLLVLIYQPPTALLTTSDSVTCNPMQHFMGQTEQVYEGGDYSSIGDPVHTTHTYVLKTDYAFISIKSRAQKSYDIPLMYLEEETVGAVVFPECHLPEVRSIIVVVSQFLDQANAIKSGCCSCKSSSPTLLNTHLRQGLCCHPRKFVVPIPQTESFVGTLPLRRPPHHALS